MQLDCYSEESICALNQDLWQTSSDKVSRHRGEKAASALTSLIWLVSPVSFVHSGHRINHLSILLVCPFPADLKIITLLPCQMVTGFTNDAQEENPWDRLPSSDVTFLPWLTENWPNSVARGSLSLHPFIHNWSPWENISHRRGCFRMVFYSSHF